MKSYYMHEGHEWVVLDVGGTKKWTRLLMQNRQDEGWYRVITVKNTFDQKEINNAVPNQQQFVRRNSNDKRGLKNLHQGVTKRI